ncbi:MAG: hypothetical protein KKD44_15740 [Proteobacteria bacterium]|nr:hypothetical protein [Pseudomonadota bacterium]
METPNPGTECSCGCTKDAQAVPTGLSSITPFILSSPLDIKEDVPCCGAPAGPPASPYEKAGYSICPYVDGFVTIGQDSVPRVKTRLSPKDHVSTILARSNIGRNTYNVAPGLYATGNPNGESPVLVTANFKLSFDHLRRELQGVHAWILVLDTRGINVWCAAGKGTFGTDELVNRLKRSRLSSIITHKKIILPQLGATGVSAKQVKKQSGFSVIWGPVHCRDIKNFLGQNMSADKKMRTVTFSLTERLVLIPVEVAILLKPAAIFFLATLFVSGIGPHFYSLPAIINRGLPALATLTMGIIAGAALTPALLDRLPGTAFSVKGIISGVALSFPTALILAGFTGVTGVLGLVLVATAISSYLAMNFTGSTPFTSPTGVEKEMKRFIPVQLCATVLGALFWLISAF